MKEFITKKLINEGIRIIKKHFIKQGGKEEK